VLPDTKPDLTFDSDGVCSACSSYESRPEIDWDDRKRELTAIVSRYKSNGGSNWDCVVPVSGGKDSTFQVIQLLELGLNPLCVTATTCDPTDIGRRNIENIKELGVDYIEVTPNPLIRRQLNRVGLTLVGDISWPEHIGIFTIPVRVAVERRVPLIIWGENSQHEYGGPAAAAESKVLDRKWLEEFGGLLGLRLSDMPEMLNCSLGDLLPYTYPSDEELSEAGVSGLFLGYFVPWDGYTNALVAQARGLETYSHAVEGSIVNYENLDNYQTGIHDYFKFLKFGFGRASDIASTHVRRGRLTRDQAIEMVSRLDGSFPNSYLGKPLEQILAPISVSSSEFLDICDEFTNRGLFEVDASGDLKRRADGSPLKTNYDNV
jgi:N-acetyl sugar amidotransferase